MRFKENSPMVPGGSFTGLLPRRRVLLSASALLGASLATSRGFAADFPNKVVHLVVSTGAGSGTDVIARVMTKQISQQSGNSYVVDNRTGAGGIIGNNYVAQSSPDGYTLLEMDAGTAITANMYKSLPYNPKTDLVGIAGISRSPCVLVVNHALGFKTVKDLIDYAHANPGKLNFGSSGVGGSVHVIGERFRLAAGIDVKHIPYDGGTNMPTALIRNDIQMICTAVTTMKPYVKKGDFVALAVTTEGNTRLPSLPDVPSMTEAGLPAMAGVYSWAGWGGPKGMPQDVVNKLNAEVVKALKTPELKEWFANADAEVTATSADDFNKFLQNEIAAWGDVIKKAGIPVNA